MTKQEALDKVQSDLMQTQRMQSIYGDYLLLYGTAEGKERFKDFLSGYIMGMCDAAQLENHENNKAA